MLLHFDSGWYHWHFPWTLSSSTSLSLSHRSIRGVIQRWSIKSTLARQKRERGVFMPLSGHRRNTAVMIGVHPDIYPFKLIAVLWVRECRSAVLCVRVHILITQCYRSVCSALLSQALFSRHCLFFRQMFPVETFSYALLFIGANLISICFSKCSGCHLF